MPARWDDDDDALAVAVSPRRTPHTLYDFSFLFNEFILNWHWFYQFYYILNICTYVWIQTNWKRNEKIFQFTYENVNKLIKKPFFHISNLVFFRLFVFKMKIAKYYFTSALD